MDSFPTGYGYMRHLSKQLSIASARVEELEDELQMMKTNSAKAGMGSIFIDQGWPRWQVYKTESCWPISCICESEKMIYSVLIWDSKMSSMRGKFNGGTGNSSNPSRQQRRRIPRKNRASLIVLSRRFPALLVSCWKIGKGELTHFATRFGNVCRTSLVLWAFLVCFSLLKDVLHTLIVADFFHSKKKT